MPLTPPQVQLGIDQAHIFAGREFTAFMLNGFRVQIGDFLRYIEDLTIEIPALPRPTLPELRTRFPWIKEEGGIESDISLKGLVVLRLGTVLRPDEPRIDGPEYERRMLGVPALGFQHADWIVEHQDDDTPAFAALRALRGKVYIDFRGLIVVSEDGHRDFPYVNDDGLRFVQRWDWTDHDLDQIGRVAVSGK